MGTTNWNGQRTKPVTSSEWGLQTGTARKEFQTTGELYCLGAQTDLLICGLDSQLDRELSANSRSSEHQWPSETARQENSKKFLGTTPVFCCPQMHQNFPSNPTIAVTKSVEEQKFKQANLKI